MVEDVFGEREFARAFDSAVPACTVDDLDPLFAERLSKVFDRFPFVINSGYRSPVYDKNKGRSGLSSHCKGLAVDIRVGSNYERFNLLAELMHARFSRIGIGRGFIHVDCDPSKPQYRIWTYDDSNRERR